MMTPIIYKKMKKTQRWLRLPLPEGAYQLLSKLHTENSDTPYFFAHLSPNHLGEHLEVWLEDCCISGKHITFHVASHSKIFYLLNISELSTLKNVTANDLETSYILFLSQLCNIQRTL